MRKDRKINWIRSPLNDDQKDLLEKFRHVLDVETVNAQGEENVEQALLVLAAMVESGEIVHADAAVDIIRMSAGSLALVLNDYIRNPIVLISAAKSVGAMFSSVVNAAYNLGRLDSINAARDMCSKLELKEDEDDVSG